MDNVIVIGSKAYEIEPLTRREFDRFSEDIFEILKNVTDSNGRATVGELFAAAILKSGKVPEWIEMMTGVPRAEVSAKLTRPQLLHLVGVFWRVNLFDRARKNLLC